MDDVELQVLFDAATWSRADADVRSAAPPARWRGRIAGCVAAVVLALPVELWSDGVYRATNLLYVGVAALGIGVLAHTRSIDRSRSAVLRDVRSAIVPALVPSITTDQLAMLVITGGVWIGRVYLLAEPAERPDQVRVVRPPNPSPEEYPGFILGLDRPAF